jgi:hypothetical protein
MPEQAYGVSAILNPAVIAGSTAKSPRGVCPNAAAANGHVTDRRMQRIGRDAGRVADEVISHLVGLVGSSVKVTFVTIERLVDGTMSRGLCFMWGRSSADRPQFSGIVSVCHSGSADQMAVLGRRLR